MCEEPNVLPADWQRRLTRALALQTTEISQIHETCRTRESAELHIADLQKPSKLTVQRGGRVPAPACGRQVWIARRDLARTLTGVQRWFIRSGRIELLVKFMQSPATPCGSFQLTLIEIPYSSSLFGFAPDRGGVASNWFF